MPPPHLAAPPPRPARARVRPATARAAALSLALIASRPATAGATDDDGHGADVLALLSRPALPRAAAPARAPSAWLSVGALLAQSPMAGEREIGVTTAVGIAFDRWLAPRSAAAISDGVNGEDERERRPRATPARDVVRLLSTTPELARASVHAAWRAAGLGVTDEALESLARRARWSALLPEARMRAARLFDERYTTARDDDAPRTRDSLGSNVALEARLTWRLDRLVYADDEPSIERMRLDRIATRMRIAAKVLDALFRWERAWLDVRALPDGSEEAAASALTMLEAEATLDVLTAGWFGRMRRTAP